MKPDGKISDSQRVVGIIVSDGVMYIHMNIKGALLLLISIGYSMIAVELGALMIVGFVHDHCDESFASFLDEGFGGLIFFTRNMKYADEVRCMTKVARKHGVMILAIDHEGTYVNRFRYLDGFVPPNAMALGSTNDPYLAYLSGYYSAVTLRDYGFNVDLAPVLDVNSNPYNPVIGVRSFWSTPERVERMGTAFMKGLMDGGVLPVIKHFPGHGNTSLDSHTSLPVIGESLNDVLSRDVEPFRYALKNGAPAIMTAHIIVKGWDGYPATLSKKILGFLRKDLGFDGMIISDDMMMRAVWIFSKLAGINPAVEAFKAGVDILLVSNHEAARSFIEDVKEALKEGKLRESDLERSLSKVKDAISNLKVKTVHPSLSPEELLDEVARRSIAAWSERILKSGKYALIYPVNFLSVPKDYRRSIAKLVKHLRKKGLRITAFEYDVREPTLNIWGRLYDGAILLSVDLFRYEKARKFVDDVLKSFKRVVLVAIRSPYDLLYVNGKPHRYIVTYDWNVHYPKHLAEVITGGMEPIGEFVQDILGGM